MQDSAKAYSIRNRFILLTFVIGICALLPGAALMQTKKPISKRGLLDAVKINGLSTRELVQQIEFRGVDFEMTAAVESEFKSAGARPEVIESARSNYKPRTQPAANSSDGTSHATPGGATPPSNVPAGPPLSKNEIVTMLQSGVASARVEQFVESRGVNFAMTPQIAREITAAGGTRSLIGAITEKAAISEQPSSTSPSGTTPTQTGFNASRNEGPDYEELTDRAWASLSASDANNAIRYAQMAIHIDATRPTAYSILGVASLYGAHNAAAAEQAMRAAIERGGSAAFRVYHDHNGSFGFYCTGSFFVTKTGVSFKADDGRDTFEAEKANIKEMKLNKLMGRNYGAFHVELTKDAGGRNYNFAPATGSQIESNLVLNLFRSY